MSDLINDISGQTIKSALIFILGLFIVITGAIISLHAYNHVKKYNEYKEMNKLMEESQHVIEITMLSDSLHVTDTSKILFISKILDYIKQETNNSEDCVTYYFINGKTYKIKPYVHGGHFTAMQPVGHVPANYKHAISLLKNHVNKDDHTVFEALNDTEDLTSVFELQNGFLFIKKIRN